jgi:ABC-type amino acid transport substrate-binding protein
MNYFIRATTHTTIRLTIVLLTLSSSSWSQENNPALTIYAIELDYRLSESGETQYNALLDIFTALNNEKINAIVRPLSRTLISFKENKSSCIFPATFSALTVNDPFYDPNVANDNFISSHPIDRVSLRILTKANQPTINNLMSLNNKSIATINGFNSEVIFSGLNVNVEYTANEETRLKMLHAERVDAVIGFVPDILLAAEALNIPTPNYNEELSLITIEGVGFICHKSNTTSSFIAAANKKITQLKNSGEMRTILGPHADIVPN